MTGTDVDLATLERIQGVLVKAARGLEDCAGSAPSGVDGGDLSSLISSMISRVCESAGGLSEGLSAAGSQVGASAASYDGTDQRSADALRGPWAR